VTPHQQLVIERIDMTKENKLVEYLNELQEATVRRDMYEIDYELEKAKLMFSAEVMGLSNQSLRDAQLLVLLEEKGSYREMAELKMKARLAWYKWASLKAIIESKNATRDATDI